MKKEIQFKKYSDRGAYHWTNYFGSLFKVDSFLRGRYDMVIQILKKAGVSPSSSVLEVGSGDGALSGLISRKFGCTLVGIEPSPEGVKFSEEMFAKYNLKGLFSVSEGYKFTFQDNHFDFVVLADVIEHLQYPELMLQEIKRVLKPRGHVIITTPIRTSEKPEDIMHVHEFFQDELIALCQPYFGEPVERIYSHPVIWYELYTFGKKRARSIIRVYCRIMDKLFKSNVFLKTQATSKWRNFKQQALLLRKL